MKNNIKTVIFDFGGVLYDIDFQAAVTAFKRLGVDDFSTLYSKAVQSDLFEKFERGSITVQEFCREIRRYFGQNRLTDEQITNAWNQLLVGYKKSRLDFVEKLKSRYTVILLSNTNQIHYDYFSRQFRREFQTKKSLEDHFHHAFFSHQAGMRKPDIEFYEYALNQAGVNPEQALFIDDTPHNLPPAKALGIHAVYHDSGQEIDEVFNEYLK